MKKFTLEIKTEENGTIRIKIQPLEERYKELNTYLADPSEKNRPYVLIGDFDSRAIAVKVAQKAIIFREEA